MGNAQIESEADTLPLNIFGCHGEGSELRNETPAAGNQVIHVT